MNKLNFLLIMPRYVEKVGVGYVFPSGITHISAAMKEGGFNVFTLNLNHIEGEIGEIVVNEIRKHKIDVVMAGEISLRYSSLKKIVDCIHDNFEQVKIIVGGPIITGDPKVAMTALEYANFGVVGEGEETSVELCNFLQNTGGETLSEIAGIIYKNGEEWVQTNARKEIDDLDSLPFPDYDGFGFGKCLDFTKTSEILGRFNVNLLPYRTAFILPARSCPFKCTFCFHPVGDKYRQRSMDSVKKEIEMLVEKYDVNFIVMEGELFTRSKDRVREISKLAVKFGFDWAASFRVDDVDEEMVDILKNGNCKSVNLGLESADNKILKSMRKGITIEQTGKTLKMVYDAGLTIRGNFILGDIEETLETATKTLDWWEKHRHYNILLRYLQVYPGTHVYNYALQNGIIKDPVEYLKKDCPPINISKLSEAEFLNIVTNIESLNYKYSFERSFEINFDSILKKIKCFKLNDDKASISFEYQCKKCGNLHKDEVKLFFQNSVAICPDCNKKHLVLLPQELQRIIILNLQKYLDQNDKIGLWGVTIHTLHLFDDNDIFKNEKFVFIDNDFHKQKMRFHGKKVYSSDEALAHEIDTVIFFGQYSYAVVAEEVKNKYPKVKRFINVCDLLE